MDGVSSQPMGQRLAVYCGSKLGSKPTYELAARQLGQAMAKRSYGLVYGAADSGLMGVLADAVLAEGGEVIGVIPELLMDAERAHAGLTQLERVSSMHGRKQRMLDLADGVIALPGGFGTFDELFEALTWAQLRLHKKPIALLNVNGYFDGLLHFLESSVAAGFLTNAHRDLIQIATDPDVLLRDFVP